MPPAVQAFLDGIERQTKVEPTYESLETDGDGNVTITNLAFNKAGEAGQPGMQHEDRRSDFSDICRMKATASIRSATPRSRTCRPT